jgi:hypothetical protein
MDTTRRSAYGRPSRLVVLTAGMLIAVLPLVSSACSSGAGSSGAAAGTGAVAVGTAGGPAICGDYAKVRPLIEVVLAMDAKVTAGDATGALADANSIATTLGGPPAPQAQPGDAADVQMMGIQVYSVWSAVWNQAQAVINGTLNAATVPDFELNLISTAYLADKYATGKGGGVSGAICPGMAIPSPYHP